MLLVNEKKKILKKMLGIKVLCTANIIHICVRTKKYFS